MCKKSGSTIYIRQTDTDIKYRVRSSEFSSIKDSLLKSTFVLQLQVHTTETKTTKENFELDLTDVLLNAVRYQAILETFFIELYPVCQARRIWFDIDIRQFSWQRSDASSGFESLFSG